MTDSLFADNSLRASILALDGLSMRQQAISRNLANIDTPGYRAQSVDFESAVQQAIKKAGSLTARTTRAGHMLPRQQSQLIKTVDRPGGSLRADENNVDIDVELAEMSETGIQYQAISQQISKKLLLLKTIANAR